MGGVLLLAGIALLVWSQKKAQEYDEAFRKGRTSWEKGDTERALVELRKAGKIDPRDPELWVLIGRCELVSGHEDRASESWEEALRRDPGYKPALFERGKEALGRHLARRLPPPVDGSTGWLPLGLESAGRLQGGAEEVQRIRDDLRAAAAQGPEFSGFARGAFHFLDGHYRDALPHLQAYADAHGWDASAIALLGIANHYGAYPGRAEPVLSQALGLRQEKLWQKARAETRYLQGNYEGARADYREAGLEKEAEPLFVRRIPTQGLILWLKADAGVETSGPTVTRWRDQSDSHHDAAPREPEGGPGVTASAIHGHPAVLFRGGKEDELRLPDGFEEFNAGVSVFVVGEPPTEPADPWSFVYLATAATGAAHIEILLGRRRESDQIVYSVTNLEVQRKPFVEAMPPARGFEVLSAIQEPSQNVRVFKRGQPLATGTLLLPQKILRTRNRVGSGLKGQIAEILVYKRSLSELERLGVEAYLGDRYFPAAAPPPAMEKH